MISWLNVTMIFYETSLNSSDVFFYMDVDFRTRVVQLILFYLEVYTLQYINKDVQTCITKDKKQNKEAAKEKIIHQLWPQVCHTQ